MYLTVIALLSGTAQAFAYHPSFSTTISLGTSTIATDDCSSIITGTSILPTATGSPSTIPSAQEATSFSLVVSITPRSAALCTEPADIMQYGYPLLTYLKFVGGIVADLGANVLYNNEYLQTTNSATAGSVVAPNQDTLYSAMAFDLSVSSLNITIPEVPSDWFHLFAFYDPYGNNVADVGSRTAFNRSGSYLLRYSPDSTSYGVEAGNSGQYVAYLNSPTTYGSLLVRRLIFNDTLYDNVHAWQNATTVVPVPLLKEQQSTGSLADALAAGGNVSSPAVAVMNMLAKFNPLCPALVAADRSSVDAELKAAGISNGTYVTPAGVNITAANATVELAAAKAVSKPGVILSENNGWAVIAPNVSGTFGTDYGLRTAIAATGYLQLQPPNAYYPFFTNSTAKGTNSTDTSSISITFDLDAEEARLYTFAGRPPLYTTGFWSLTLYQTDYFVNNSLDRSALGDRSNITFPSGTLVYNDGGLPYGSTPDGPFQILVQPADVTPPANWTSNWLPGPAGGGTDLSVIFRLYDAEETAINGPYVYPVVTTLPAIRA